MSHVFSDELNTGICVRCGFSHRPENRQRLIAPMLEEVTQAHEIAVAWGCLYDWNGAYRDWRATAGARRLFRDLKVLRTSGLTSTTQRRSA